MIKEHILFLLKYKQFVVLYHPSEGYIGVTKIGEKMFVTSYYDDLKNPFEGRTHLFVGDDVSTLEDCSLHSTFDLPKSRYKIGQKVRVREDAEKWFDYQDTEMQTAEGKENKIGIIKTKELGGKYYHVEIDGVWYSFPHEALDPVYEEDKTWCPHEKCEMRKVCRHIICTVPLELNAERIKWLEQGEKEGWVKDCKIVV